MIIALRGAALAAILAAILAATSAPLAAQSRTVQVGPVTSVETCTYFQNREGAVAAYADHWFAGFAASWRSWWVKDCQDRFVTFRASLAAALASTGRLKIGSGGYSVSVSLSNLNEGRPAPDAGPVGEDGYSISRSWASVGVDLLVRDRGGSVIYGAPFVKKIETGYDIQTGNERSWGTNTGPAMMAEMQSEVALAIARVVTFKIDPLVVTGVDGTDIALNYGSPILKIGDLVSVEGANGLRGLRYKVVSTGSNSAVAEVEGDNATGAVRPGAPVRFIESDSDEASGRRLRRVPLP